MQYNQREGLITVKAAHAQTHDETFAERQNGSEKRFASKSRQLVKKSVIILYCLTLRCLNSNL